MPANLGLSGLEKKPDAGKALLQRLQHPGASRPRRAKQEK
jgi:hypothetical protein